MLFTTLASAILNNPFTAKLPLPINIMAPLINITVPLINILNTQPTEAKVTINYSRDLVILAKIYTEESKYSGENDNFNYKLIIFGDFCNRVNIPQEVNIKGFLIMLYGIAFNFTIKTRQSILLLIVSVTLYATILKD